MKKQIVMHYILNLDKNQQRDYIKIQFKDTPCQTSDTEALKNINNFIQMIYFVRGELSFTHPTYSEKIVKIQKALQSKQSFLFIVLTILNHVSIDQ